MCFFWSHHMKYVKAPQPFCLLLCWSKGFDIQIMVFGSIIDKKWLQVLIYRYDILSPKKVACRKKCAELIFARSAAAHSVRHNILKLKRAQTTLGLNNVLLRVSIFGFHAFREEIGGDCEHLAWIRRQKGQRRRKSVRREPPAAVAWVDRLVAATFRC